jgi:hypothetical protein
MPGTRLSAQLDLVLEVLLYSAELVGMTDGQLLELLVADPPTTSDQASRLAREQAQYCPTGLAEPDAAAALIATGVTSPAWTFCWD